ncbi:MAG: hypothetical protein K9G61_03525 [Bacteroidales bacterium]|nr:hypothetical protein [Bacteroidales bacterium]
MSRLSAQGAWEVLVEWSILPSSTCQFMDLPNDRFVVFVTIIDDANNRTVVNNTISVVANDVHETSYDFQTALQTHCEDNTLAFPPSYTVYTAVRMVHITDGNIYCYERSTDGSYSCTQMEVGTYIPITFD